MKKALPPGAPLRRVDLKVAFGCNNFCLFCVQGRKRALFAPKSFARIKRELEAGYAAGGRGLVLTGGEPALHRDLLKTIEAARALGYTQVQVQSNGRLFR